MMPLGLAALAGIGAATSMAAPAEVSIDRLPLVLGAEMAGDAALLEELELRLPDHPIVAPASRTEIPSAFLWIGAARRGDGVLELQVIVSDGRLYQRPVVLPAEGERARVTAGAIANLVDGIERQSVVPTRTEVEVPTLGSEADADPQARREAPQRPQQDAPSPKDVPRVEPRPAVVGQLHVWASGAFALGVGPPRGQTGPVGAGAALGVAWVRADGLLLGGALRGMGWRAQGLSMGRIRLLANVGYAWTRKDWSIVLAVGPSLEPLWLNASVREAGGGARRSLPLFGAAASAGPRWQAWSRPGGPSLWVGADLEAAGSAEARRRPGVVFVQNAQTGDGLLRAGGLELGVSVLAELRVPRSR